VLFQLLAGNSVMNILILCTGNSARSVMAEAILNRRGAGRFQAYSAGSKPVGAVNPVGLELLQIKGYETEAFRSKSWDEFSEPEAPKMDAVITVCSNAAGETCPIWPGSPIRVHWGFPDPAVVTGTRDEKLAAFEKVYREIDALVEELTMLPDDKVTGENLKIALQTIAEKHEKKQQG